MCSVKQEKQFIVHLRDAPVVFYLFYKRADWNNLKSEGGGKKADGCILYRPV